MGQPLSDSLSRNVLLHYVFLLVMVNKYLLQTFQVISFTLLQRMRTPFMRPPRRRIPCSKISTTPHYHLWCHPASSCDFGLPVIQCSWFCAFCSPATPRCFPVVLTRIWTPRLTGLWSLSTICFHFTLYLKNFICFLFLGMFFWLTCWQISSVFHARYYLKLFAADSSSWCWTWVRCQQNLTFMTLFCFWKVYSDTIRSTQLPLVWLGYSTTIHFYHYCSHTWNLNRPF